VRKKKNRKKEKKRVARGDCHMGQADKRVSRQTS